MSDHDRPITRWLPSLLVALLLHGPAQAAMVTLHWDPVTTTIDGSLTVPDKYTVYRSVQSAPPAKLADLYQGTAFVDLVTAPGQVCYKGTSTNAGGESQPSNLACVLCRENDRGQIQCKERPLR
jgi:hypothetical protein